MVNSKLKKHRGGFTLMELLVVVSIMTIVTTIIIGGQRNYVRRLNLFAQGYKVLAYIRQAQVYGLGVRANQEGSFDSSYGVSFTSVAPNNTSFTYFIDKNIPGNVIGRMDPGEEMEVVQLERGVIIEGFPNGASCSFVPPGGSVVRIDISFRRPNPKTNLRFFSSIGSECEFIGRGTIRFREPTITIPSQNRLDAIIDSYGSGVVRLYGGGG